MRLVTQARWVWFLIKENLRGTLIMTPIVLAFLGIGLFGYSEFDGNREVLDATPGRVVTIVRFPRPGADASGSTLWAATVELPDERVVVAEFIALPRIGEEVCILRSRSPTRSEIFQAFKTSDGECQIPE